jgi:N-acyl-D-amino-acid deacylase
VAAKAPDAPAPAAAESKPPASFLGDVAEAKPSEAKPAEASKPPEEIKKDPDFAGWVEEHGGWDGIVLGLARRPQNKKYEGMRIAEIAKARGDKDPADACLALMAEENGQISGMFHTMSEQDVRTVMKLPWVAIASDGSALNLTEEGFPHPRSYSTNARVLGHYVRDEKVLMLEDAIRKMTSLPAQTFNLRDRGQIREGFAADIVIFNETKITDKATFDKPHQYAEGFSSVIVNGKLVFDGAKMTGVMSGVPLYGTGRIETGIRPM